MNGSALEKVTQQQPETRYVEIASGPSDFTGTLGRKVLVAENDDSLAGFLQEELCGQGFVVDRVSDGEAAVDALEAKRRFDLLLTALDLPKLDGISLIRKARPEQPKLSIMVLTGRNRIE